MNIKSTWKNFSNLYFVCLLLLRGGMVIPTWYYYWSFSTRDALSIKPGQKFCSCISELKCSLKYSIKDWEQSLFCSKIVESAICLCTSCKAVSSELCVHQATCCLWRFFSHTRISSSLTDFWAKERLLTVFPLPG